MNCKVTFADSEKADALLAPKQACFSRAESHVFLMTKNGDFEKRR